MNAKLWGALAGTTIITLALTAGHYYAESQTNSQFDADCAKRVVQWMDESEKNIRLQEYAAQLQQRVKELEAALSERTQTSVTHNDRGGYIAACGTLPGVLGDDC